MCGRYYIDDEMVTEIEKIVRKVNEKFSYKGDIYPTNKVPIIHSDQDSVASSLMTWGFPNHMKKGVLINARSETVKEKKTFSSSVTDRRCIVPATGFYEWDAAKNKIQFKRSDNQLLFMAGIWKNFADGNRFVILTTGANASMEDIHDRMPLVLEKSELESWIFENDYVDFALHKVPVNLKKIREYEQGKLHF